MKERKNFEISEMKEKIFARDHYTCRNCGESIWRFGQPCLAHGIHKSKANIAKYGEDIVHSEHNMYSCCGGYCKGHSCNDSLNVGVANEEKEAKRIRRLNEKHSTLM